MIPEDLLGEVEASKVINSVPTDAALEVKVNIGYRATRRKLKREFMNNIAAGLRNTPDGEIKVRGKNDEVKGDDLTSLQSRFVERAVERKQGKKFSEAQSDKPTASSVSNYGERLD